MLTFGVCTFVNLRFQRADFNGLLRTDCGTVNVRTDSLTFSHLLLILMTPSEQHLEAIIHEGFIVYCSLLEFDELLCMWRSCSTFNTCKFWGFVYNSCDLII